MRRYALCLGVVAACGAGARESGPTSRSPSPTTTTTTTTTTSPSPTPTPSPSPTPSPTPPAVDPAVAQACADALQAAALRIYAMPPRAWADPALTALSACEALPSPLRDAAGRAIGSGIDDRSRILADAAAMLSPPACRPADPHAPAAPLAAQCAFAPPVEWVHEWAEGVDAGVWLYLAVTARELATAGIGRGHGPPILDQLWKGAAWERAEP